MLGMRTLTAVIGFPLLWIGVLNFNKVYFVVFLAIMFFICIYECSKMFLKMEGLFEKIVYPILSVLVAVEVYFEFKFFYIIVFLFLSFYLFRNIMLNRSGSTLGRKTIQRNFNNLCTIFLFSLYMGIPFAMLFKVRLLPFGEKWFIIILLISWGGDVGGYFAGKYLKKIFPLKLFSIISPNKTWIGALGSIILSITVVFSCNYFFKLKIDFIHLFLIAFIGNIFSQIGDLFESFIKRTYKIKDSGTIIPGHGGLLDRIDGVLFVAPFLYWYLKLFIYV